MLTREIGKSGLKASILSLGAWAIGGGEWWGDNDDSESIATINNAIDLGVNWIDTARVYGFGHSEKVVGEAIRKRRQEVILATKCGLQWYDNGGELHFLKEGHNVRRDLSAKAIRRDLEFSLKELDTDYIDIYITHWQTKTYGDPPIQETMQELLDMKKEGKIRAIGVSNVTPSLLKEYLSIGQVDVVQEKLSLIDRDSYLLYDNLCKEYNITLQAYSPLENGLLTGGISNDYLPKKGEVRENKFWWKSENILLVNEMLNGWQDLTEKYNCTIANLVIKWTTMLSNNINVLCGARKVYQIEDNLKSLNINLSDEDWLRMKLDADKIIQKVERK